MTKLTLATIPYPRMSKRAVLRCNGAIEQGFLVTLEISDRDAPVFTEAMGGLPPAVELLQLFSQWQQLYYQSLSVSRMDLESISVQTGKLSQIESCKQSERELKSGFKTWLESPEFQPIERRLRETLMPQETVEILLRTTDRRLHRLPWHVWDFVERYPGSELVIGSPAERIVLPPSTTDRVRILAILGDRQGIDTTADRAMLEAIPGADIIFLVEPSRSEVYSHLWEQAWDVLFFAGHSKTEQQQGRIYLNPTESLILTELSFGLQRAITRGLQLTIFNSCDGLGLADELEQLHIPHSIVMREPVPDRVAQAFLKQFLAAFAAGAALHTSVRQARESLQGLEGEFPAASWLPTIFQNPTVPALTWARLQGDPLLVNDLPLVIARSPQSIVGRFSTVIIASIAVTGLVLGIRHVGLLQSWELSAFDLLMRLRPPEQPDQRILIVTVTEADILAQTEAGEPRRGSLSDRSLEKLLAKLAAYQPIAIGLDIYRDHPISKSETTLIDRLKTTNLVGVCKVSDAETGDPGVAPPPEITSDNVGFSDVVLDPDLLIRRHYLALEPPAAALCQARYAFSVQLALRYLANQGINLEYLPNDRWKLGKITFAPLTAHGGGYQQISPLGHQILLNYRSTPTLSEIAPQVTLQELLAGRIDPGRINQRIVLIGTTAASFGDRLSVPYPTDRGETQSLPGVVIQAQMVSQLLSAALDGRALIGVYPIWIEVIWIWGSAVTGGLLVWQVRRPIYVGMVVVGSIAILAGTCLCLLQSGYWVPLVPGAIALVGTSIYSSRRIHVDK